ncbi:hypothetical protein G6F43_002731 [Rhizopus delemar]|nr:hypothetical protein G6F43_002731 [Rhizopus delemar]
MQIDKVSAFPCLNPSCPSPDITMPSRAEQRKQDTNTTKELRSGRGVGERDLRNISSGTWMIIRLAIPDCASVSTFEKYSMTKQRKESEKKFSWISITSTESAYPQDPSRLNRDLQRLRAVVHSADSP